MSLTLEEAYDQDHGPPRPADLTDDHHSGTVNGLPLHQVLPFTAPAIALPLHEATSQQAPLDIEYREVVILHGLHAVHGHDVLAITHQPSHLLEDAFEHCTLLRSTAVGITLRIRRGGRHDTLGDLATFAAPAGAWMRK